MQYIGNQCRLRKKSHKHNFLASVLFNIESIFLGAVT